MFSRLSFLQFQQHSKRLFTLALPILLTQFCQTGLGTIDTLMAGRLSALDLAAVAVGSGIWLPIFLLGMGILIATTPLIGEAVGRDEHHHIPHITQQSLWTALAVGVVGFVVVNIMPNFFGLMKVADNIRPLASEYLHWVSLGVPAMAIYAVLRCYCEALERPEPVTIISVIGLLSDIPLNYAFIYGKFGMPAMGGAGCGLATALVLWINVLLLAGYLAYSKHHKIASTRFFYGFSRPSRVHITKLLKLGLPIGVSIFFEASLFSLAALVISPLGDIATAAHQVALSISAQLFMIPMSIAMGLTIMVANRYGERNLSALKEVMTTGLMWSIGIACVAMLGIFLFRSQLAQAFSKDVEVQTLAMGLLLFAMAYQIFDAIQVNVAGILRGIQDTTITMIITFVCYWLLAMPLGIYLVHYTSMGVSGFWLALVIGLSLASILLMVRLWKQQQTLAVAFRGEKSVS